MSETMVHLVDEILPVAPYRQFVLTFPFALRFWLAANNKLLSKVNKITIAEIAKFYIKQAEANGLDAALPGAITFVQRSGSALNANLHLHILQLEGVFSPPEINGEKPLQHALSGPTDEDVATIVEKIGALLATDSIGFNLQASPSPARQTRPGSTPLIEIAWRLSLRIGLVQRWPMID